MEEKLENMFEIIKQENKDYKEHLERGDLFIPNELYKDFKPNEYPIPRKDGGTRLVNICPNCHYTFHKLESENENE